MLDISKLSLDSSVLAFLFDVILNKEINLYINMETQFTFILKYITLGRILFWSLVFFRFICQFFGEIVKKKLGGNFLCIFLMK
jgi:hypothetical protein